MHNIVEDDDDDKEDDEVQSVTQPLLLHLTEQQCQHLMTLLQDPVMAYPKHQTLVTSTQVFVTPP